MIFLISFINKSQGCDNLSQGNFLHKVYNSYKGITIICQCDGFKGEQKKMNNNVLKLLVEYGIFGVLICLSIVAVTIAIERIRFYKQVNIHDYKSRAKLQKHLTHHLNIISTIASNAPYIGLFGTVLGIMLTFAMLGQTGDIDVKSIMTGLAFALKATAIGIGVAIPCVFLNNFLTRKVKEKLADFDEMMGN